MTRRKIGKQKRSKIIDDPKPMAISKVVTIRDVLKKIFVLCSIIPFAMLLCAIIYSDSRDLHISFTKKNMKVLVQRVEHHTQGAHQGYFEFQGKMYHADCPHWVKEGNYLSVYRDENRDCFISTFKYSGIRFIISLLGFIITLCFLYLICKFAIKDTIEIIHDLRNIRERKQKG
ncbi:MAG: hypothetical protein UH071_09590 [Paludibacteraceae bacterium]|nr:hypothetical protein [Paludibacteraceae bacterium]